MEAYFMMMADEHEDTCSRMPKGKFSLVEVRLLIES